jgi:hypothetical protein
MIQMVRICEADISVFAKELKNVASFIAHSPSFHGEVPEERRGLGKGEASTPTLGIVQLCEYRAGPTRWS